LNGRVCFYQKIIHGIQIKEMLYHILGISPADTPCAVTYLEKDTPRGFLHPLTIFFRKTINRPSHGFHPKACRECFDTLIRAL
jgi:hypothetical protein